MKRKRSRPVAQDASGRQRAGNVGSSPTPCTMSKVKPARRPGVLDLGGKPDTQKSYSAKNGGKR